jgi:hypothetical protein
MTTVIFKCLVQYSPSLLPRFKFLIFPYNYCIKMIYIFFILIIKMSLRLTEDELYNMSKKVKIYSGGRTGFMFGDDESYIKYLPDDLSGDEEIIVSHSMHQEDNRKQGTKPNMKMISHMKIWFNNYRNLKILAREYASLYESKKQLEKEFNHWWSADHQ